MCSLSDTEGRGYECACGRGYNGSNCNNDRNECIEGKKKINVLIIGTLYNDDVILIIIALGNLKI